MIQQLVFVALAALTLGAALGVVTSRSVFVSALWLVASFVGVAGIYVLLEAVFLGGVQLLVYVGAVSVLVLFAIMLTRDIMTDRRVGNAQRVVGAALALAVFGALAFAAHDAGWQSTGAAVPPAGGGAIVVGEGGLEPARVPGAVTVEAFDGSEAVAMPGPTVALGRSFVTDHLLAFEIAGAMLLVALVGAIAIARD